MSREEFSQLVISVADYLPSEERAVAIWAKYKIRDTEAVLKLIKKTPTYVQYWNTVKPIVSRVISDIPDKQLGQDIIGIIDQYYPGIIAGIVENDKKGKRGEGDLLHDVISSLIAEVRVS